jgi:histone acetyltransferase
MKLPQAVSLGLLAQTHPQALTSPSKSEHLETSSRPLSPASSALSDPPPNKRRRYSSSSLSDVDDDDDEEDQPLAARLARKTEPQATTPSKRGAKKGPGIPKNSPPNPRVNGSSQDEPKVKEEDKMDDSQLSRLATGVTVDADSETVRYRLFAIRHVLTHAQ